MPRGLSDEEYQKILAANPDWQDITDQEQGFSSSPAPAMASAQPQGLRFYDKPDEEQYLGKEQKQALKSKLHAYLADKMQRRAAVTSKPYYDKAEEAFAHQERVSDANALGGLLLNAGDRAGTVLGRGPASNFGQFSNALDESRQTRIGNMRALRGMEEQSNMNDLQVARYLTELERGDEARKDKRKALYEQMLAKRQQSGLAADRLQLDKDRLAEVARANQAREQIMRDRPIGGDPSYSPIATSDDSVILINPKNPADQRSVQLPKGFKPKGAPKPEASVDKASADIAKNFEADFAKKSQIASVIDRELAEFKRLKDAGDEDGAVRHGEGMLKALNSAFGADAVGTEEAERLGGFLQRFKAPWKPGSTFSRDLDLFYKQVEAKSRAIKQAGQDSLLRAQSARKGGVEALIEPDSGLQQGGSGKNLNEMSLDELKAERDRLLKGGG